MEFFKQEYRSGLPFLTPGDLPDLGIEPESLASPALAGTLPLYHLEAPFMQLSIKKSPNNLIKKLVEEPNRHVSKDIRMAKKYMKKCSAPLIIKEMQIKTIMRQHLITVRMVMIRKSTNCKC